MARKEAEEPFASLVGDFEGGHGGAFAGIADLLEHAEGLERRDHRLLAGEAGAPGVGAEFAIAGVGRNDDGTEDHENHFKKIDKENVAHRASLLAVAAKARDDGGEDAGEEHDEGVDDALQERHGHHIAVGDVGDLMADDSFDLGLFHAAEEARGDGDEGAAAGGAGGKGIHLVGAIDAHFGHLGQIGFAGEAMDDVEKMALLGIGSVRVDHLHAHHPLRHRPGKSERNESAPHAPNKAKDQQRSIVDPIGLNVGTDIQQVQNERDHQYDQEVQNQEENDSFGHLHRFLMI